MPRIEALLAGKTAQEKSRIKGEEIAKAVRAGEFTKGEFRIEIQSVTAIEGGVEVFVRAWAGAGGATLKKTRPTRRLSPNGMPETEQYLVTLEPNTQIGFGKDGSVEIERFRFYIGGGGKNGHLTHIVVPDPNGDISVDYSELDPITGETREWTERYREDPEENLRIAVANTIRKVGKENGKIVPGKVGRTTSTFNPAAGANEPVDGSAQHTDNSNNFTTAREATNGTSASATSGAPTLWWHRTTNTGASANRYYMSRLITLFDTSFLGGGTVLSATLTLKASSKDLRTNVDSLGVYASNPINTNNVVVQDYDYTRWGTTLLSNSITFGSSATAGNDNVFTLNASGNSAINGSGLTKMGIRILGDVSNTNSIISNNSGMFGGFYNADDADSSKHPKLVVEHESPASGYINLPLLGVG